MKLLMLGARGAKLRARQTRNSFAEIHGNILSSSRSEFGLQFAYKVKSILLDCLETHRN